MKGPKRRFWVGAALLVLLGSPVVATLFIKPAPLTKNPLLETFQSLDKFSSVASASSKGTRNNSKGSYKQNFTSKTLDINLGDVIQSLPKQLLQNKFKSGSWNCTLHEAPNSLEIDCVDLQQTPLIKRIWAQEEHQSSLRIEPTTYTDFDDKIVDATLAKFESWTRVTNRLKRYYLEYLAHP